MRVFVHEPEVDLRLVEDISPETTASALLGPTGEHFVFLDNVEEPIDIDVVLVEIITVRGGQPLHHHVHRHPCAKIIVRVNYGGDPRDVHAAPNATVGTVLTRALRVYGIDSATGADLVLRLPGSATDLPQTAHIGDVHRGSGCSLELNLLPAHREAG